MDTRKNSYRSLTRYFVGLPPLDLGLRQPSGALVRRACNQPQSARGLAQAKTLSRNDRTTETLQCAATITL